MKPKRKRIDPNTLVLLKHIGMGVLVMVGVALLITAVWYGTRVQALTIDTVKVSGGETIKHSEVEVIAKRALEGTYLGLVPKKFTWLYPESGVREAVEGVPRTYNVSVERNGRVLSVAFNEYVPKALWCNSVESEDCVFLDSSGYSFGKAPKLSGGSFLRFVKITQSAKINETIESTESFNSLVELVDLLAQKNWFVSYVEIGQGGDSFLQIVGGGELRITLDQTPTQTVENLLVILSSDEFKHLEPGNFQYVDLRYGNKVFVNEEPAEFPEEEAAGESASSTTETELSE